MRWWLLAVALLLAGCSGPPSAGPGEDGGAGGADGTATLRAVAVDQAIRPVPGATVTVEPPGLSARTGEDGEARFDGLPAGEATVLAEAAGYLPARAVAILAAGEREPAPVVLVLLPDPAAARYVEAAKTDFVIEAGLSAGLGDLVGPTTVTKTEGGQFRLDGPLPAWLQSEAFWESVQPAGDLLEISLWVCAGQEDALGTCETLVGGEGPSPVHVAADAGAILDMGYSDGDEVMPLLAAVPPSPGGATLVLQQPVSILTHAFHGFSPPAGWLFSRDGAPVVPPA